MNDWPPYRARVFEDASDFSMMTARLHIINGQRAMLMADGTWSVENEAAYVPSNAGILLPRAAMLAAGEAIARWAGPPTGDAATEARVLREWLAVERERVERAWNGTMLPAAREGL